MQLPEATEELFSNLRHYLAAMDETAYCMPIEALSNSTLGQHTRHVIEFFQCIAEQSDSGVLSYDKRPRDHFIEESPKAALVALENISQWVESSFADRHLLLQVSVNETSDATTLIPTTCLREWNYALEHAIHHMAMIRIGAKFATPDLALPENFGVGYATIKYRKGCVQ
ncbi:MAG: hypothetical protein SH857_15290 [Chitinophagales bacterium]|nr:hypothetical protein [Chitinophagales bacterium]